MAFAQEGYDSIVSPLQIPNGRCAHTFVPMRTERLVQDGRNLETVSDIYCTRCGHAIHLHLEVK